jgi:hypothetical protein
MTIRNPALRPSLAMLLALIFFLTNTHAEDRDLIDFSDFFPTLAEFADAEVPADLQIDGRSFAPQLRGEPGDPREHVYCWYFRNGKIAV